MMPTNNFFRPLTTSDVILRDEIAVFLQDLLHPIMIPHPALHPIRESLLKIEYQHELLIIKIILALLFNKNKVAEKDIIEAQSVLKQCDFYLQKERERPFVNEKLKLLEIRLKFWPTFLVTFMSAVALFMIYKEESNDFSKKSPLAKLFIALIPVLLGVGTLLSAIVVLSLLKCFAIFPRHKKPGVYVPLDYDSIERDNSRIIDVIWYYFKNEIPAPECPFAPDTLEKINDFPSELQNFR